MDYYMLLGNLLYVQQDTEALWKLLQETQQATQEPSICLLLSGSYWSLLGHSQKAILDFTQAVSSQPDCYDGWLLLGHEYSFRD